MAVSATFAELIAEAASVPVDGWDFSWFEGRRHGKPRASEERPSWGYAAMLAGKMSSASSALDIETGGGEVLAWALGRARRRPGRCCATESWPPNLQIAARNLAPFQAPVVRVADDGGLPFRDASFDLVSSRHPVVTDWVEIARVLRPGARCFSQQIGPATNLELKEFFRGPLHLDPSGGAEGYAAAAEAAGLDVLDLRLESLRAAFYDVAAVAVFLRKVVWIVPGFTIEAYHDRLAAMHEQIERDGCFVSSPRRVLIEARRPD